MAQPQRTELQRRADPTVQRDELREHGMHQRQVDPRHARITAQ